jgi:hypothetical protein
MAAVMAAMFRTLEFTGVVLQMILLWRLSRGSMWRTYGGFSLFALWLLLRSLALYITQGSMSPGAYRAIYWETDLADMVLRFLLVWEVFHHTFPKGSGLHKIVSKGFTVVAFGLVIFSVGIVWSYEAYARFHSVYPVIERSFGFAQAVMILGLLLTARYYGVQLGRNVWGIAVAFGAWSSLSTANNAMIDLRHSFLPYWQLLLPLSAVAMFAVWVWAVWVYAPNPALATQDVPALSSDLDRWTQDWDQANSTVRRVIHP